MTSIKGTNFRDGIEENSNRTEPVVMKIQKRTPEQTRTLLCGLLGS